MKPETKNKETVYSGRVFSVTKEEITLPGGRQTVREVMHHPGAAAVVAMLDEETVLMVRNFRHGVGDFVWELPAGTLEEGETPRKCASRELLEETGYKGSGFTHLAEFYPSPGLSTERIFIFKTTKVQRVKSDYDTDEISAVVPMTRGELKSKYKAGKLVDGKTVFGLTLAGVL